MSHPREDRVTARPSRSTGSYVNPVQLRLVGPDLSVIAALDVLREVFSISDVSDLSPDRNGTVRFYATICRRYPLTGGNKWAPTETHGRQDQKR